MSQRDETRYEFWKKDESNCDFVTLSELESKIGFKYLFSTIFKEQTDREQLIKKALKLQKKNKTFQEMKQIGNTYQTQIKNGYLPKVFIRWIDEDVGYGLFAKEFIVKDSYVGEYVGIIKKNDEHLLNNYLYSYPMPDSLGRNYVIDATSGNLTRFINHSVNPNLKPTYAFIDGMFHLIFLAISEIASGEQLCYNYGKQYWYVRSPPKD